MEKMSRNHDKLTIQLSVLHQVMINECVSISKLMWAESLLFLDGYDTYFKAYDFFLFAPVTIHAKKERKRQLRLLLLLFFVFIFLN